MPEHAAKPRLAKARVLFACVGSTCRSLTAEFIARERFGNIIEPLSTGFRPRQAADAENAIDTLRVVLSIDASGHTPREIRQLDLQSFDLAVTMEKWVADRFAKQFPADPPERVIKWKIDDPCGDDLERYRTCPQAIFNELKGLVKGIVSP